MNVALSGETPLVDYNDRPVAGSGRPLCGNFRAAVCQLRGDWEWYTKVFYFGQWNENIHMCPFCRASNRDPELQWSNFAEDAGWRGTRWSHETYMAHLRHGGLPIPIMFRQRGGIIGLRLECTMVDVLHTVDQGIASHIIANIIWVFMVLRAVLGGSTYAERIKRCHAHLKLWYSRNRTTSKIQGALTPERVRPSGDWPRLKAKAAATRHLAGYALHLVQEFGQFDSLDEFVNAHDNLALGIAQCLVRFYSILMSESQFLTPGVRTELPELGNLLASMYSKIATLCFNADLRLWKLSPKLHLWLHLTEDQVVEFGNPRFWWCYGDEDLVGQMIELAEGLHPSTMSAVLLTKWMLLVFDDMLLDPMWSPFDDM
jgi:hypothetical protein